MRDARALRDGGCDGFVVENFGDRPFTRGRVEAETVAAMTRVIAEVTAVVRLPFGVNVLRNDALSALAIAAATGAAFIRVNVHTGAMLTDQGIIEGDAVCDAAQTRGTRSGRADLRRSPGQARHAARRTSTPCSRRAICGCAASPTH